MRQVLPGRRHLTIATPHRVGEPVGGEGLLGVETADQVFHRIFGSTKVAVGVAPRHRGDLEVHMRYAPGRAGRADPADWVASLHFLARAGKPLAAEYMTVDRMPVEAGMRDDDPDSASSPLADGGYYAVRCREHWRPKNFPKVHSGMRAGIADAAIHATAVCVAGQDYRSGTGRSRKANYGGKE